ELAEIIASMAEGRFSDGDRGLFEPIVRGLVEYDPFFVLADFRAYVEAQQQVAAEWRNPDAWTKKAILNVASMGRFSSDRSIHEYAKAVWDIKPVHIQR